MKTYKIYNEEQSEAVIVSSLTEVRALTEANDEQIKRLFAHGIVRFDGLTIVAY